MRRISGEKQRTVAHGLGNKGAQWRNGFFQRGPAGNPASRLGSEAQRQFIPEAIVRPVLDLFGQWNLDVVAAARVRTHRGQRKAILVVGVDQFVIARRHVGKDPQPAEGIDLFKLAADVGRNRLARYAMKTIATGDVHGIQPLLPACMQEADPGRTADVMQFDFGGLPQDLKSARWRRIDQVPGQLGLSIDHYLLSGQGMDVDAHQPLAVGKVEAVMGQAFRVHARAQADAIHDFGGDLLQHSRPDARAHMCRGLSFQDHDVNAGLAQQVAEHESGRAGADDCYLGLHFVAGSLVDFAGGYPRYIYWLDSWVDFWTRLA